MGKVNRNSMSRKKRKIYMVLLKKSQCTFKIDDFGYVNMMLF